MAAVQSSQFESLEVRESGRALKVQTDNPHLVSIGSGRLSTNVTWHPLPEGKVTIGASPEVDIVVQGTGVQPKHCIIENNESIVTLYPIAEMTSVDGLRVTAPTRLFQGNMLCIGRSNYLRFNHPAEANLMKKYLPNTRISMAAPLNFFGNGEGFYEKKPPMPPGRRSRDSWGESSCEDSPVSTKPYSKSISPKVFPPGSATVNSPASVVLGHSRIPNGLLASTDTKSKTTCLPVPPPTENGTLDYIEPHHPQTISNYPQKPTVSPAHQPQNGFMSPQDGAGPRKITSPKLLSLPSPAFNRNPSPYVPDKYCSITPDSFAARSPSPSPSGVLAPSAGSNCMSDDHPDGNPPLTNSNIPMDDLYSGNSQMDSKIFQVQNERKYEQRTQMLERQRLDEILNVCAEYERQIQSERQTKMPTTPTLHQNRIKTNGSLPRDKRNNGLPSPLTCNSDDELNQVFTFDTSKSPTKASRNCLYDNVRVVNNVLQLESSESNSKSPYENLRKPEQSSPSSSSPPRGPDVTGTNAINSQTSEKTMPPQSPRTRIRTTVRDQSSKDHGDLFKPSATGFEDYDTADPIRYRDPSPNHHQRKFLTPSQQLNKFSNLTSLVSAGGTEGSDHDKFIFPLETNANELSNLMMTLEKEFSATLSELKETEKSLEAEIRKEESWNNEELNDDLPESERHIHREKNAEGNTKDATTGQPETFLRQKKSTVDWGKLKVEKSTWLTIVTRLKSDINSIEQQEEEILREFKMEMALLNAEYLSQKEKHEAEENKLAVLREKQKRLDEEIDQCKRSHLEVQNNCHERIHKLKKELQEVDKSAGEDQDTSEEYKTLTDKLEAEKKSFEDLEFKQLEEEAHWLATKDELQRDIQDITARLDTRKTRLSELDDQIRDIETSSQTETSTLQMQKMKLQEQLEDARNKMKDLDIRLSAESSLENYSGVEEGYGSLKDNHRSKRSQEDLVRISKVTSDAPIDVGKTGSLGRKTIESLKEIERNRQIHLANKGSQVIEEERKRVEQLKRRVQDEVRAQWEQSRQRECNSLNSVGSEESNITYSDQPTESASSDDIEKTLPAAILPGDARSSGDSYDKMRKESDSGDFRISRPISDYSGSDLEQQLTVKKREMKPSRHMQQRPLTRYLPIKSESLNLRQHIESAGHQVDLCPHVSIDATSCRGLLHKLGGKFHHWNKRWFVFDRTKRTLTYFSDKSEKKQRGGTYFQSIEEVYVDHLNSVKSPNPHVTFVMKTHERTYYLMAPSPEAMRIWVDVIFTGAEGYQEFEHGS